MPCPECGTPLQPDEIWLKKGSNSWYTLCQCPSCTGSSNAAGQGVFQRYKLSRRDGLHWSFARCAQMPDARKPCPLGKASHRPAGADACQG